MDIGKSALRHFPEAGARHACRLADGIRILHSLNLRLGANVKPTAPGTLALFKECNPFYDFLGSNQTANKKSA
jgi:hypothetical protein